MKGIVEGAQQIELCIRCVAGADELLNLLRPSGPRVAHAVDEKNYVLGHCHAPPRYLFCLFWRWERMSATCFPGTDDYRAIYLMKRAAGPGRPGGFEESYNRAALLAFAVGSMQALALRIQQSSVLF